MAILSAMINARPVVLSDLMQGPGHFDSEHVARLVSQVRTIAAFSIASRGGPAHHLSEECLQITANFLHMLFSDPV